MNNTTNTNEYDPTNSSVLDLVNALEREAEKLESDSELEGILLDAAEVIRQVYREAGFDMSEAQSGFGESS